MRLVKCQLVILHNDEKTVALIPLEYTKNYRIITREILKQFYVATSRFNATELSSKQLPGSSLLDEDDIRCIANNNNICYVPVDKSHNIVEFGPRKSILIYLLNTK